MRADVLEVFAEAAGLGSEWYTDLRVRPMRRQYRPRGSPPPDRRPYWRARRQARCNDDALRLLHNARNRASYAQHKDRINARRRKPNPKTAGAKRAPAHHDPKVQRRRDYQRAWYARNREAILAKKRRKG